MTLTTAFLQLPLSGTSDPSQISNGTAAAPSYGFSAQTGDGMYDLNPGLAWAVGGTQRLSLDGSGNLVATGNITGVNLVATNQVVGPAGSAGTPSLSFTGHLTDGFYDTGAGIGAAVGGVLRATIDAGGYLIPAIGDPSTFYQCEDFVGVAAGNNAGYSQIGTVQVAFPGFGFATPSTMGMIYAGTSSTTQGGYIGTVLALNIVKSTTINYQWRFIFYLQNVSTSTNRFTAYVGGIVGTSTATNTNPGPFAGPYLAYSDNLNSGDWVMGSGIANVRTTGNSSVAATTGWHNLTITLANGTYTYVLDGTSLGTVADSNMVTTTASNQAATIGGVQCIPDGSHFTTASMIALDRADIYITGLSR